MIPVIVVSVMLSAAVMENKNTVGILGYRESLIGNRVVEIHQGSPVEGILQKGDRITAVDGKKNCHKTTGEPGSEVTLTVARGKETFDVTVKRIAVQAMNNEYLTHYFGLAD